jgi:hypothetical protein
MIGGGDADTIGGGDADTIGGGVAGAIAGSAADTLGGGDGAEAGMPIVRRPRVNAITIENPTIAPSTRPRASFLMRDLRRLFALERSAREAGAMFDSPSAARARM